MYITNNTHVQDEKQNTCFYIFPYYGKGSILCSLGDFLSLDACLGCETWGMAIPRHIMCIPKCSSRSVAGNVRARIFIYRIIIRVCNHVIAVYSENNLQHYATAYRNHKSAGEKLGIFRFCKFFLCIFSKNTLQPVQKSLFNWIATRLECSWQAVAYICRIWCWKSLNRCCSSKLFDIFNVYQTI